MHTVVQIFIVLVRLYALDDAGRVFSTNYTLGSEITYTFLLVEVLQILLGSKQVCI